MLADARTLPEDTLVAADICIIGAGAAGITLARELASSNRRIAVFESGGLDFNQATQDLYQGKIVGQPFTPLASDRLRYFGGSTNHWTGSCRPFDPVDFAARPYIAHSGWPFGRDVLEPFYRRAQEICQLGPFTYDPRYWTAETGPPLALGPLLQNGVYQYSLTRFGQAYRQDLATAPQVTVYLNANLVGLDTGSDARAITGLRLACLEGPKFRARADCYVLATGGIENARLLLNADRVSKGGLGNGADLVGRYFMDHPYFFNAATVRLGEPDPAMVFYEGCEVRGTTVQGYLSATATVLEQERLPNFSLLLQRENLPDHDFSRSSLEDIWHAIRAGRWPQDLSFHVGRILDGLEWKVGSIYDGLVRSVPSNFSTTFLCECPPDPDSRVTLIADRDALGLRRVELDWRLPSDLPDHLYRTHELLAQDLGKSGRGRLRMNLAKDEILPAVRNGHHHMGTTRMHPDPKQGVVDADCRVHGIANLFIAGSSVFPTYSFDDPTLTIVALALRLADHLKTELRRA